MPRRLPKMRPWPDRYVHIKEFAKAEIENTSKFRHGLACWKDDEPAGFVLLPPFREYTAKRRAWFMAMGYITYVGANRGMIVMDSWYREGPFDDLSDPVPQAGDAAKPHPDRREAISAISYDGHELEQYVWFYSRKDVGRAHPFVKWEDEVVLQNTDHWTLQGWMQRELQAWVHAERTIGDHVPEELRGLLEEIVPWVPELMAGQGYTVITPEGIVFG